MTAAKRKKRAYLRRGPRPPSPLPGELVAWRQRLNLGQREAAGIIFYGTRAWETWEAGTTPMHPLLWQIFQQKARALEKRRARKPPPPKPKRGRPPKVRPATP